MREIYYLGREVEIIIDRPKGTKHPDHDFYYELNYGYLPNTKAGDGEPVDVYLLDADQAVKKTKGKVVGIILREDDDENKLVLASTGQEYTESEITKLTHFQEQYFQTTIVTLAAFEHAKRHLTGLKRGLVDLYEYTPFWELIFYQEAEIIRQQLGPKIEAIKHVGSTAIPHIKSKPIIDIMIGVHDFTDVESIAQLMTELGYFYKGENGIPDRHYFTKGDPRMFHVHMVLSEGGIFQRHLTFRDRLRANIAVAKAYHDLKVELATTFKHDRVAYTEGKHDFIRGVLAGENRNQQNVL